MKLPHLLLTLAVSAVISTASAQERPTAQSAGSSTDITALQRKLTQQTEQITALQSQLSACRMGEDTTAPAVDAVAAEDADDAAQDSYSHSRPAYHSAPSRRTSGVYQSTAEQRLTCADYSNAYFSRHPAMAAACGVDRRNQQVAPVGGDLSETETVSVTTPAR